MTPDPVLIVGGGPVGLLAGQLLAKSGINTVLIEKAKPTQTLTDDYSNETAACISPKSYALSPTASSLLQEIGVWPQLLNRKPCPYRGMEVWDRNGTARITFSGEDAGFPQLGHIVQHDILMHHLWQQARQTDHLSIITGQTPVALRSGEENSWLKLSSGETVTGSLIIGADGANSQLRTLAELGTCTWPYQQTALAMVAELSFSHLYKARQAFTHRGTLGVLPIGCENPHLVLLIWSLDDDADELKQADDAQLRRNIAQTLEIPADQIVALRAKQHFPLAHCHARTWVKPGLALIGDAAHSFHPLAGQGMNLGFEDAATLADLLQKHHARSNHLTLGNIRLLRTYQRKRLTRTAGAALLIESLLRGFRQKGVTATLLRNQLLGLADRSSLFKSTVMRAASGIRHY